MSEFPKENTNAIAKQKEIGILKRVLSGRFPITQEQREQAVRTLNALMQNDDPRVAVSAVRTFVAAEAINQADDHLADRNARLDAGLATDRMAIEPVVLRKAIPPQQVDS